MHQHHCYSKKIFQKFLIIKALCAMCVLISCNHDSISPTVDVGYDYYPAFKGKWIHYDVDSTVWDDFTSQTYYYHSQILEKIDSIIEDGEGNLALRIERYYRKNDTANWVIKDVWLANVKPASVEVVEENVRFVKLCFPVRNNLKWDGNAFNYLNSETYIMKNVHEPFLIGTIMFDSTLTVWHNNIVNLIEEDVRFEIYAKHVGLIKKYSKTVTKNIAQPDIIVRGTLVEYTIRNYGQ